MSEEETEIRWRRNSWSSLSRADESISGDEPAIGCAPVTLDLTDKAGLFFFCLLHSSRKKA